MRTLVWVLVVVVVLAVMAAAVWSVLQARRRAALQQRFGPEYDRAVDRAGGRRAAEAQLTDVADRRDRLELQDLSPAAKSRYDAQWQSVQARFVDEPGQAVTDADGLVTSVMRDRGYPVEDFGERASMVAADHPDVVEHYRGAHEAHARHLQSGQADTEDLRQAFVHYRALYAALSGGGDVDVRDRSDARSEVRDDGYDGVLHGRHTDATDPVRRDPRA
jgi:type II secretory pathway component PulK